MVEPEVSSASTEDQEETAEAQQDVNSASAIEVEATMSDQEKLFKLLGTAEPDWEAVIARYAAANLL